MKSSVLIIGGGIIGVSAAYFLAREGVSVTLVDARGLAAGSSWGNAGLISPNHSVPIPAPGVLGQGLKWLLDPESPLYIKPRFDWELIRWLWRFRRFCTQEALDRAIPVLRDMQRASLELFRTLIAEEDIACDFEARGGVIAFLTEAGLRAGVAEAEHLARFGLKSQVLDRTTLLAMEPALSPQIVGGVLQEEDAFLTPHKFLFGLADAAERHGAHMRTGVAVKGFEVSQGRILRVQTTAGMWEVEEVILAAGAWSTALAAGMGVSIPMQPAKGYSITLPRPSLAPSRYIIFGERNAVATPMGDTLRLAGTLELSGLHDGVHPRRVQAIRKAARAYLRLPDSLPEGHVWQGLRPVPPDGLPYLGRSRQVANLIVATGHAMLGLSMGPITGRIATDLVLGRSPALSLDAFDVDRFA
jgi:D-amino-acid dehydrogenase